MEDSLITLFFLCFLIILMPRRKVCKTVKGKRICNKKRHTFAGRTLSIGSGAFKHGNEYSSEY